MSHTCVLVAEPESRDFPEKFSKLPIGAMWLDNRTDLPLQEPWRFGRNSVENLKRRKPLWVKLPGELLFLIDGRAYDTKYVGKPLGSWGPDDYKLGYHGEGWTVTGEPPLITCSPSIHFPGYYHGFLTTGVVSDG
jgi:hypothetical protein